MIHLTTWVKVTTYCVFKCFDSPLVLVVVNSQRRQCRGSFTALDCFLFTFGCLLGFWSLALISLSQLSSFNKQVGSMTSETNTSSYISSTGSSFISNAHSEVLFSFVNRCFLAAWHCCRNSKMFLIKSKQWRQETRRIWELSSDCSLNWKKKL